MEHKWSCNCGRGPHTWLYGYEGNPSSHNLSELIGVWGDCKNGIGVFGTSDENTGVYALATGKKPALLAHNYGNGLALEVAGQSQFTGLSDFNATVVIRGLLQTMGDVHIKGSLTKGKGQFKIDHPVDPANKYLSHSFVESPDMKNIYDGVVVLDEQGEAEVQLPDWFEPLNQDFRYQLTAIGAPAPKLHIARKIEDHQFRIAGGNGGLEVSWQVTGIRHDAYATAHPIAVEEEKLENEKGLYLHPEEHGQSVDKAIHQNGFESAFAAAAGLTSNSEPLGRL